LLDHGGDDALGFGSLGNGHGSTSFNGSTPSIRQDRRFLLPLCFPGLLLGTVDR
jgi:hypothetical protein